MTTERGRDVPYHEEVPPIKSRNHTIMCSYEITWQTEIIVYPLPQCL